MLDFISSCGEFKVKNQTMIETRDIKLAHLLKEKSSAISNLSKYDQMTEELHSCIIDI